MYCNTFYIFPAHRILGNNEEDIETEKQNLPKNKTKKRKLFSVDESNIIFLFVVFCLLSKTFITMLSHITYCGVLLFAVCRNFK